MSIAEPLAPPSAAETLGAVAAIRSTVALFHAPGGGLVARALDEAGDVVRARRAGESLAGILPPVYPEWLGSREFAVAHGVRFAYVAGEMARGIATARMAIAAARAGCLGFFGSAGLPSAEVADAISVIDAALGPGAAGWGANLIHSPNEAGMEMAHAELFIARGVRNVSASAFMRLTPACAWIAAKGLARRPDGGVQRRHQIFAKVSRAEVARPFLSPAPADMLQALVAEGRLSAQEADLAARIPVAEDITVEGDSGGHTDNRPLLVMLPAIRAARDEIVARYGYAVVPRVGAAGGIGTPSALAAAFAAGADYAVTGSINQCAVESGLSADGRGMLAAAGPADVMMAPAADMFEMGVKVQVLKRGTLFAPRGQRLYDAYRRYARFEDIPDDERATIENDILARPFADIWRDTAAHFAKADPAQVARAEREPRHKMALVFRWYLFMGAQWAREGVTERRADYQIWCGPAMGAFNDWTRGSFLADPARRTVAEIACNLLEGAAALTRAHHLRLAGVALPAEAFDFRPRPLA